MDRENGEFVRFAIEEIWNQRGDATLDRLVTSDFVMHLGMRGETVDGPAAVSQYFALLHATFPGLRFAIDDLISDGDRVAFRWSIRLVSPEQIIDGDRAVARNGVSGIDFVRLAGGKLVESWTSIDQLEYSPYLVSKEGNAFVGVDSTQTRTSSRPWNRKENTVQRIQTVIVGGGQAGLATSYYLEQENREHVVLEQAAEPANAWRNQRWDSFTLVTPNWTLRMPGAEYDGPDRNEFMPRDKVVDYFERYVDRFQLPIQFNSRVIAAEPTDGRGYLVRTEDRTYEAENVVIATGFEQLPKIPSYAANLDPEVMQLHSSQYRNPESLPEGAVLVVGSAQSGAQIAEELNHSGRQVFLSTGSTGRAPRRYRGKDVFEWLFIMGFFDIPAEKFPFPIDRFTPPHLSGAGGGRTLNLHQFARDGVTLLGHLRGVSGDELTLAPDLHENLARADQFEVDALKMIDGFIQANGLDAPLEEVPQLRDGYEQPTTEKVVLSDAEITTVIWATGYRFDAGFVHLPVHGEGGFPIQSSGISPCPGLYFVGMPWMPSIKPGTLAGAGESAKHIVDHLVGAAALSL
jgi:putative flavoprotein involved in K+ transport